MSGAKLAALYGLIPNQLGFCGPRQELLKKFIRGEINERQIIPTLKKFEAAYPYYQLIAKKNKTSPFNRKIIEAYWLGNRLLDKVSAEDLRRLIRRRFARPGLLSSGQAKDKAARIPNSAKPHHSFHVLILGSITGRVNFIGQTKLKDTCRISWGEVIKIKNKVLDQREKKEIIKIIVRYKPLVGKKTLSFGRPIKKEVIWDKNLVPVLKMGDWVSIHWRHAIQKLKKSDIKNLEKYTRNTLNALLYE